MGSLATLGCLDQLLPGVTSLSPQLVTQNSWVLDSLRQIAYPLARSYMTSKDFCEDHSGWPALARGATVLLANNLNGHFYPFVSCSFCANDDVGPPWHWIKEIIMSSPPKDIIQYNNIWTALYLEMYSIQRGVERKWVLKFSEHWRFFVFVLNDMIK